MKHARRAFLVGAVCVATCALADERAPLRVAVGVGPIGSAFWIVRDAQGVLRGLTIDLGTALAERLGRRVIMVPYANSGDITAAGSSGAWDVTFVPMDATRAATLDFGPAYDSTDATWIVRPGSPVQTSAELDTPGARLAAVRGTATGRAAQASLHQATITGYATFAEIVDLLRAGEIDAAAFPRDTLDALAARVPGSRVLSGSFGTTRTAIAVPKGHPDLLAEATSFIEAAVRDGTITRLKAQNKLP